jgi:hypothetical protein
MYLTSIDISENTRLSSAVLLNARLADALDLAAQLKHAHWNIHGPHFMEKWRWASCRMWLPQQALPSIRRMPNRSGTIWRHLPVPSPFMQQGCGRRCKPQPIQAIWEPLISLPKFRALRIANCGRSRRISGLPDRPAATLPPQIRLDLKRGCPWTLIPFFCRACNSPG